MIALFHHSLIALIATGTVFLVYGCDEMNEAMDTGMANRKDIPDIDRSHHVEDETILAPVYDPDAEEPEPETDEASIKQEPIFFIEPELQVPRFGGIPRRLVIPLNLGRRKGVRFELMMAITGPENVLDQFKYDVEIRDQSGNSKTFPMTRNNGSLFLKEIVYDADIGQTFEYQIRYYKEDSDEKYPFREESGAFSVSD